MYMYMYVYTDGSVHQLESMERSLKLYCSQFSLQCQRLLLSCGQSDHHSSSPSMDHWQTQLQQVEEEKSQLLK